jgi:16S rRNA (adenine1518-N6/adenine1519-N6)-dimethyltransferase
MSMYQPGALREFLNTLGISPKKGLSQNFLIDGNILRKIVSAADVQAGDEVLEIGPGPGALTEALLASGAKVRAIEKDGVMAEHLRRFQTPDNRLTIECGDALEMDFDRLFRGQGKIKVIANLPYHITTPILASLIPLHSSISRIVVMVQDEVARRIAAKAGEDDYGSFSVFSQFYADVSYAFKVSRNCFYPVPKVDSAVVVYNLREGLLTAPIEVEGFFKLTRTAFGHRRKMLKSSLKDLYNPEDVMAALKKKGLNPIARPEELSAKEFLYLYENLRRI